MEEEPGKVGRALILKDGVGNLQQIKHLLELQGGRTGSGEDSSCPFSQTSLWLFSYLIPTCPHLSPSFHRVTLHVSHLQGSCPVPVTGDWFVCFLNETRSSLMPVMGLGGHCLTSTYGSAWPKALSKYLLNGLIIEWIKMNGEHLLVSLNEDLFEHQQSNYLKTHPHRELGKWNNNDRQSGF